MASWKVKKAPVIQREITVPGDTPLFRCDAALMEHVIANLLLNAALHTPAGGTVRVSAGVDAANERVFLAVNDSGNPPLSQSRSSARGPTSDRSNPESS